jgi:glycosyltransferase involved in cell wall biosynthesis
MSPPVTVVLACDFARDEKLGSSRVPLRLARELEGLGARVTTLFTEDLPRVKNARAAQLTSPFRMALALERAGRHADIVDVAGGDAWAYAAFARRWRPRQVVVSRSNGLWYRALQANGEVQRGRLRRAASDLYQRHLLSRWERASISAAHLALFGARSDGEEVVAQGWKRAEEVAIVAPGVDEFFESSVPLEQRRDIAFVGTMIHRKGADVMAAAVAEVMRERASLGLTLFGPGISATEARSRFDDSVRARVTVVDSVPSAELATRLSTFAVMVFPSRYEGFGLVTLEAMRAGLAVVVTATGAGADVVRDGTNGLVVPIDDVGATAAALRLLIDDPALRVRLAAAGREEARARPWARTGQDLLAAYEAARERLAGAPGR